MVLLVRASDEHVTWLEGHACVSAEADGAQVSVVSVKGDRKWPRIRSQRAVTTADDVGAFVFEHLWKKVTTNGRIE